MGIDALDRAAGLARVEEGSVDQVLDRMSQIGIRADIGRIFAAKLETGADEAFGCGLLDGMSAGDRAREGDEIDARVLDDAGGVVMAQMQELEEMLRQAALGEGVGKALGA